jgi:hypothetical protein
MTWMDALKDRHTGKRCYLIGKGPSLDRIDSIQSMLTSGVIVCVNESIHKIESLGIAHPPLYVVQQDSVLKDACVPKLPGTIHLMNSWQRNRNRAVGRVDKSDWNEKAVLYNPHDIGCMGGTPTGVVAIKIARIMGMTEFILIGFDSWKDGGSLEYGECIGYSSKAKRPAERFLAERHYFTNALEGCKYENIFL